MYCAIHKIRMIQGKMQIGVYDRTIINVPCLKCPKCGAAFIPEQIHDQARATIDEDNAAVIDYEEHYGRQTPDLESMMPTI